MMNNKLRLLLELFLLLGIGYGLLKGMVVIKNARNINRDHTLWEGFPGSKEMTRPDVLPRFTLKIKTEHLVQLNENLKQVRQKEYLTSKDKQWFPCHWIANRESIPAKVRVRGDTQTHWGNEKKSWRIKLSNDKRFLGMREFNIVVPEDKGVSDILLWQLADKMRILHPRAQMVLININEKDHGLYCLIEHFSKDMLAYSKRTETAILGSEDPWVLTRHQGHWAGIPYRSYEYYWKPEFQKNYLPDSPYASQAWEAFKKLCHAVEDQNIPLIRSLLDMRQYYMFSILIALSGNGHGELGFGNTKLYFNAETGHFEIIPWDLSLNLYPSWGQSLDVYFHITSIRTLLESDPISIHERLTILYDFLKDDTFLNSLENDFLGQHHLSENDLKIPPYGTYLQKSLSHCLQMLQYNRQKALALVTYGSVYLRIERGEDPSTLHLTISPQMYSPLEWHQLELAGNPWLTLEEEAKGTIKLPIQLQAPRQKTNTILSSNQYAPNEYLETLAPSLQEHHFIIRFKSPLSDNWSERINLTFFNAITHESIPPENILRHDGILPPLLKEEDTWGQFLSEHPQISMDDQKQIIKIPKDVYNLKKDLRTPEGWTTMIAAGTNFLLEDRHSIIFQGPVFAKGEPNAPITFKPNDPKDFYGTVAIVHQNELQSSELYYCSFERGAETWVGYQFFSGTLAVYGGRLLLDHVSVFEARGDDGLNTKHAKLTMRYCTLSKNSSDAIDADFSSGTIEHCTFVDNGGDSLDFSGGNFIVQHNLVLGSGDKGISAGEQSFLEIRANEFRNNAIGVASKDLSIAKINKNLFISNDIDLSAYQKKPLFGGGTMQAEANYYSDFLPKIEKDSKSKVDTNPYSPTPTEWNTLRQELNIPSSN